MWPNVPALPAHVTSMRRAPIAARTSTAAPTVISRTIVSTPITIGTLPSTRIATTPTASIKRSAVGSRIFPTVDTWFQRRAIHPSTQSVQPRTARSHAAPYRLSRLKSSQRNNGMQSNRITLITLGTVRTRSGGSSTSGRLGVGAIEQMRAVVLDVVHRGSHRHQLEELRRRGHQQSVEDLHVSE